MQNLTPHKVEFEEEGHVYKVDGLIVPSLSQVLQVVGLTKSYEGVDPYYALRGTAVHKAIELDLEGTLDESSVESCLRPFLDAWRAFCTECLYRPVKWEQIYYNEDLGYCCRIDHFGVIGDFRTLIDVKCTKRHDPGADFQLCGQESAMRESGEIVEAMAILELHDDGTYKLCRYPLGKDIMKNVMCLYRRIKDRRKK